jgi:2-phospho-L-lactate transferase/gluconeogenesis factor (CofD/UPF0052 family)
MHKLLDEIDSRLVQAQNQLESAKSKSINVMPLTDDVLNFLAKVSSILETTPQDEKLQVCVTALEQLRNWSIETRGDSIRNVMKNEERIEALKEVKALVYDADDVIPSRSLPKEY